MAPKKPINSKKMEKIITFFTDDEMFDTLENAKFYLKKSKGEILREALTDYIDKNFPIDIQNKVKDLLKK